MIQYLTLQYKTNPAELGTPDDVTLPAAVSFSWIYSGEGVETEGVYSWLLWRGVCACYVCSNGLWMYVLVYRRTFARS